MMNIRKSEERGHVSHGWLDSHHTFSFADYYDPQHENFRSLRVINEDFIAPGRGFGAHPHQRHGNHHLHVERGAGTQGFDGNGRVIRAGEAQYMAAGTGIMHSEFNPKADETAHLLQIWILPDKKGVKPRYAEKSLASAETGKWHLVTSKTGRDGSMAIHQDADLWLAKLEPGQKVAHKLATARHAWLHVAEGRVAVNGQELAAGDAAALDAPGAAEVKALERAQVLLFDLN